MDFTLPTEYDEAGALAAEVLGDHATPERLALIDARPDRFDPQLWAALAKAGLLSLALSEDTGGHALSVLEACAVAVEAGRRVAGVPYVMHTAAALVLDEFAGAEIRDRWLKPAATGAVVLTAATGEQAARAGDPPALAARESALTGVKTLVPHAMFAGLLLVTAQDENGPGVYAVAADAPGLTRQEQPLSDGDRAARCIFDRAPGHRVGGADAVRGLSELATVLGCAYQVGVLQEATRITAEYACARQQFGRAIGTFQAVSHRLADAYIDCQGANVTMLQAAWRLAERLDAAQQVAVAKLWAADAGHRVAHTTVHVHGGVGIDLDAEPRRYFLAAKRGEFMLGGATEQARLIGGLLAAD